MTDVDGSMTADELEAALWTPIQAALDELREQWGLAQFTKANSEYLAPVDNLSLGDGNFTFTPVFCAICHEPESHKPFHHPGATDHPWHPDHESLERVYGTKYADEMREAGEAK